MRNESLVGATHLKMTDEVFKLSPSKNSERTLSSSPQPPSPLTSFWFLGRGPVLYHRWSHDVVSPPPPPLPLSSYTCTRCSKMELISALRNTLHRQTLCLQIRLRMDVIGAALTDTSKSSSSPSSMPFCSSSRDGGGASSSSSSAAANV